MASGGWTRTSPGETPLLRRRLTIAALAPWIALLIPLYVYLFGFRFQGRGDSTPAELLPIALFHGHGFDFREFVPGGEVPYWFRVVRGRVVSAYPVLPGLMNVPVYAAARADGVDLERNRLFLSGLTASAACSVSVLFLYLTLSRICRSRGVALGLALVYAFGTTVWSVASRAMLQHGPSVLFLSAALWALWRGGAAIPWAGLALGLAVINRPTNLAIALPLAVSVAVSQRRRFLPFCALAAVPAFFQLWYGSAYLESPFASPQLVASHDFSGSMPAGLAGLLFSPSRGLFVFSPFLLFSLPAIVSPARLKGSGPQKLPRYLVAGVVLVLLIYSRWRMWWGGSTFGYRMITELAPLLTILLALSFVRIERSRPVSVLFSLTVVFSVYVHFLGAMVGASGFNDDLEGHPEKLWSIPNSEIDLATRKLVRIAAPQLRLPARSSSPDSVPTPSPRWWHAELDDDSIPGAIDFPGDGASVRGPLEVSGWAKSPAGEVQVRVAISPDGLVPRLTRVSRPDVAAADPGLGDCSAAGWRAVLPPPSGDERFHALTVELREPGGRVRRLGPIRFRWTE